MDEGEIERGGAHAGPPRTEGAPLPEGAIVRGGGCVEGGSGGIDPLLDARRSSSERVGSPTTWSAASSTARAEGMSPG